VLLRTCDDGNNACAHVTRLEYALKLQAELAAEAAAKVAEAQRLKEEKLKESRRLFPRILGALGIRKVSASIFYCYTKHQRMRNRKFYLIATIVFYCEHMSTPRNRVDF